MVQEATPVRAQKGRKILLPYLYPWSVYRTDVFVMGSIKTKGSRTREESKVGIGTRVSTLRKIFMNTFRSCITFSGPFV